MDAPLVAEVLPLNYTCIFIKSDSYFRGPYYVRAKRRLQQRRL